MTNTTLPVWEAKRTDETRQVEDLLRKAGFEKVDAYRYNSASIRLRVIDSRFERLSAERRERQPAGVDDLANAIFRKVVH